MRVASWASRHARFILFTLAVLVVAGAVVGTTKLPLSLFPRVDFPRLRINIEAGEQPAEQMAIRVTRPMEESLRSMPGVRGVESRTSRGAAEIWLTFDWGEDMAGALLRAESQINRILPTLPPGTSFDVRRMDPTLFSTISYSITSDSRSQSELRDLAAYQLRPMLLAVTGVAKVDVQGGDVEEYRVDVNLAKLRARGLSMSDLSAALAATNVLEAVGVVEDRHRAYLVVNDTRFVSPSEIEQTVLRAGSGGVVHLGEVATVRSAPSVRTTLTTANGRSAVLLDVYQQPNANTVDIAENIRKTLDAERKHLPSDVTMVNWYDQSDLILSSAHGVREAVLIGVGLAAIVLLLFLRNWRITLVAALTVPIVLAVTALLLYLLHESFNIMTLGGMAAAVGLIIDDAIVMSEHIVRRVHGGGTTIATKETRDTVIAAADEFAKPLTGSSLATIIIHIPPAFLIGVTGAFFAALSFSMAASLIVSLLVAWLALPALAARLLRGQKTGPLSRIQHRFGIHQYYASTMRRVLHWPWLVLLVVGPLMIGGYFAYQRAASGFMPAVDEGGFVIDYVAPPGTALTETDRILKQVERIIAAVPEVESYSRRTGLGMGGDFAEQNTGDFFVRLKPLPRRPIGEVIEEVRKEIDHTVPGLEIEIFQLMEDVIGDITGRPEPVVINLFSEDERVLLDLAPKVQAAIEHVPNLVEVKNGIVPAGDALNVNVDRDKAALEGVDVDEVTKQLDAALTGTVPTQMQRGSKLVDVHLWIPQSSRRNVYEIAELPIRATDGHVFPLRRVATSEVITGQPEITRIDLKQAVAVTGRIEGRDLGSTIRDVRAALDAPGLLPSGVRYTLGGLYEQQQIAFRGMLIVIAAAAMLVFLLLLFLYESVRVAVVILFTSLMAIAFVFIGLWLTGTELNVSSLMGIVMIVGNVTEVAIFYFSEFADFVHSGDTLERLIAAGAHRMRAIAMTTIAAILALLPLALGVGRGSAMLQPLAIAIIIGLLVQFPLVLVAMPALLKLSGIENNREKVDHPRVHDGHTGEPA